MAQIETKTRTRLNVDVTEPPLYKVIYINDNQTAVDFVISTLVDHFEYTFEAAHDLTMDIHNLGSAVVAILPYEIAEQKGIEITISARAAGFPLQIKLEPANA